MSSRAAVPAPTAPRRSGRRARLSRDQVVAAAVELADRQGLEALTMRRVGAALGVEAMSLYRHVDGREALLDGMVDVVFGEIDRPSRGADWRQALRANATSTRAALLRHPWAIGIIESLATPGPENLRHRDALLGALLGAGFTARSATHAINLLDSFVYGHTLQERTLPFDTSAPVGEAVEAFVSQIPVDAYPHLAAAASELSASGFVYADEFEFGLSLILDGLDRLALEGGEA